eukprot:TRINITY_DN3211_c0_g1::TRINITY_DN3211_c0_g1_i1::g.29675::m.29675 TRINITY_DN3211_c0_g1::TRINITY_DN3211_c0_g1_i1::g.29675  ORF type:complete len:210 (-),score=73.93,KID/PF02524.9/45,KID/PF02524.9/54 TRINITY_DN3211_c0_g1_i1:34-663(-)
MDGAWATVRGAGANGTLEQRRQMWYKLSTIDNVNKNTNANTRGQKVLRMATQVQIKSCRVGASLAPCTASNFPDLVYMRVLDQNGTAWVTQEIDYIQNEYIYLKLALNNSATDNGVLAHGADIEIWEPYSVNYDEVFTPVTQISVENNLRAFNTPVHQLIVSSNSSLMHGTTTLNINSALNYETALRLAAVQDSTYQGYTIRNSGTYDP